MVRFGDPIYLWLLVLIPLLALVRSMDYRRRRQKLKKFSDPELLKLQMADTSKYRLSVKFWLLQAALALLIIMFARPQIGSKIFNEKRRGIKTIIALDISNSMMAENVVPSRLARSKLMVENLVDNFTNDKIGLVVFAGEAFVQLPTTSDYVSAKMLLQNADPSLTTTQGTNIVQAIRLSMSSFTQQDKVGRAVILITDGEDHEGEALEATKEARKKGINVYILGVGETKGVPISTLDGDYMTDDRGRAVMTALNEKMCQEVAKAGEGAYIHVDNTGDAQKQLNDELAKLQKGETNSVTYSEHDEQFQAFAILALLSLILEVCMLESKNPMLSKARLFKKKENREG